MGLMSDFSFPMEIKKDFFSAENQAE